MNLCTDWPSMTIDSPTKAKSDSDDIEGTEDILWGFVAKMKKFTRG